MNGINYGRIFSDKYNKRFITAIFVLFILIFYGVSQLYGAKFQAKEGAEEIVTQDNTAAIPAQNAVPFQPPAIEFTQLPEIVKQNEKFIAEWLINSDEPKTVTHTAIHYGYESRPGTFSTDVTPQEAGYESFTPEFASGEYPIPNMFATAMELPKEGTVYLRAHAIIDGKNYWTEEKIVRVGKF